MFDSQQDPAANPPVNPFTHDTSSQTQPAPPAAADTDLMGIKAQALQNLTPLVDKLDQTPEEKFKTTMMLIQASDNAGLIKRAYEAASQIKDEKVRAQALIDIINEINYFTQQSEVKKDEPIPPNGQA
jgi:hypothetical protein